MLQVDGMGNVHVLPVAITPGPCVGLGDDIRTFARKPCGNGIGGSAHDDLNIMFQRA